jgi:hypothetical protein
VPSVPLQLADLPEATAMPNGSRALAQRPSGRVPYPDRAVFRKSCNDV